MLIIIYAPIKNLMQKLRWLILQCMFEGLILFLILYRQSGFVWHRWFVLRIFLRFLLQDVLMD
ncbi:hypothetical protein C1166_17460 [Enterobacter bugandensis]|uniref:Uncharacterized protein n=1 Tax=Enterobacter bugandensis TaxID=881260 RepID=A0ABX4VRA7_9ENTR|nr:hypothetical protein C1166_17460 [Enterobacter bugandensis]PNF57021.1 hypothetical protein C1169_21915 [Enterobacter bugandensis]PNF65811.1 hypothetical protein C1168_21915 [Enterobacter bugandensis]PNF70450.1 hypothetical protein C1167_21915 [Enterobacter bugandensis]RKN91489.1 hypothetical protein D8O00_02400 [Enterobacter bugandensis]